MNSQIKFSEEFNKNYIGKKVKTLVENISPKNSAQLTGRTEHNKIVIFDGAKNLIGQFCKTEIESAKSWTMFGKLIT